MFLAIMSYSFYREAGSVSHVVLKGVVGSSQYRAKFRYHLLSYSKDDIGLVPIHIV